MSIFYDADGFAHETERNNYYSDGFPAPLFDFGKNRITDDFVKFLKDWFSIGMPKESEMEEYIEKTVWDDFTEPPKEVYIMIGNGFDIECGLPTGYGDFLKFLKAVERVNRDPEDKLEDVDLKPQIRDALVSVKYEIWKPVLENFWYDHFQKAILKQRWIDFEAEIARVIRIVENSMDLKRYSKATMEDYVCSYDKSELHTVLGRMLLLTEVKSEDELPGGSKYTTYKLLYRDLRDKLLKDLNAVISGFETYLREYVETIAVEPTENITYLIERLRESPERHVLSFNYTTTFERMIKAAGVECEFCYVHGKVGDGRTKNRMVLGIDEHLGAEGIKNLVGFAPFRKYNQRIFKATDSNYMDWLDYIKSGRTLDRMLYIFGHSIGITDKDIIGPFIQANDMRTVLFYHSEDAFSDQVSNLTAIIGMDEMIQRTGGKTHTMEFRKQKQQ